MTSAAEKAAAKNAAVMKMTGMQGKGTNMNTVISKKLASDDIENMAKYAKQKTEPIVEPIEQSSAPSDAVSVENTKLASEKLKGLNTKDLSIWQSLNKQTIYNGVLKFGAAAGTGLSVGYSLSSNDAPYQGDAVQQSGPADDIKENPTTEVPAPVTGGGSIEKTMEGLMMQSKIPYNKVDIAAAQEYTNFFDLSPSKQKSVLRDAESSVKDLVAQKYTNVVSIFFDQIMQGLGKSTGGTTLALLEKNDKLMKDTAMIMEGSYQLYQSDILAKKGEIAEAKKMKTAGAKKIMLGIDPDDWNKIVPYALQASKNMFEVDSANQKALSDMATQMYAISKASAKGSEKSSELPLKEYNTLLELMNSNMKLPPDGNGNSPGVEMNAKLLAQFNQKYPEILVKDPNATATIAQTSTSSKQSSVSSNLANNIRSMFSEKK